MKVNLVRSFIALSLLLSFVIVYIFIDSQSEIMPQTSRAKSKKRFNLIVKNIDIITKKPEVTTLFLGTSIFQYFLYPPDFNKPLRDAGIESRAFNLAFEGNFGLGFFSLSNRLQSEFSGKKKFRAVVIELCPASMNRQSFIRHKTMIDVGNPDVFMNSGAWQDMLLNDPAATAYLSFNRLLKPFDWNHVGLYPYLREQVPMYTPKPRFAGIAKIWSSRQFYEKPEWKIKNFGMVSWNFPIAKPQFDEFMTEIHQPENWENMLLEYARGNGLLEARGFIGYEESVINYYIDSVKLASKYADKVFLLRLPYAPSFQRLVDAQADETYVVNRVKNETSAVLIDYTKSFAFEDKDFADAMHLRHETMTQVMSRLGEDLKPYFK